MRMESGEDSGSGETEAGSCGELLHSGEHEAGPSEVGNNSVEAQKLVVSQDQAEGGAVAGSNPSWELSNVASGKPRACYGREELFAICGSMRPEGAEAENVLAALEPFDQEFYEMEVGHGSQKPRHKTVDRRQRGGAKAKTQEKIHDSRLQGKGTMVEIGENLGPEHVSGPQFKEALKEPEVYEDDSEDEIESFQPRAFAVEGEPDFESGEPQDGWEYLRRVKWEYARCPKVKVAKIDPSKLVAEQTPYMPVIPSVAACPPHLLPSKEWETEFLADFSSLRLTFSKAIPDDKKYSGALPSIHNQAGWEVFCFGSVSTPPEEETMSSTGDESESVCEVTLEEVHPEMEEEDPEYVIPELENMDLGADTSVLQSAVDSTSLDGEPSTSIQIDHVSDADAQKRPLHGTKEDTKGHVKGKVVTSPSELRGPKAPLLGILMKLDEVQRAALLRYHIAWLERVDGLPQGRAQWLFALAIVVDKPLDAQTSAAFRALLRRCATLRSSKTSAEDEELHRLNLLITIAGRYFGQSEDVLS